MLRAWFCPSEIGCSDGTMLHQKVAVFDRISWIHTNK